MLVFTVTPFKIDRNKNKNRSIDKARIWKIKDLGKKRLRFRRDNLSTMIFLRSKNKKNKGNPTFTEITSKKSNSTITSIEAESVLYMETNERGSTIGLAGCGIGLFSVVIIGMGAKNISGMREF